MRILRGAHPDNLTCGEIGSRMVTPEPDVTRLVDRVVKRELVVRQRDTRDRRVVRVGIAESGLDLLATLDEPLESWMAEHLGHITEGDLNQLSVLLEKARRQLI